jgi:hypothetical protein
MQNPCEFIGVAKEVKKQLKQQVPSANASQVTSQIRCKESKEFYLSLE